MRNYEAVVIIDPRLEETSIKDAVDRLTQTIESKGEVAGVDQWGRRRLAYEIDHLTEGFYVVVSFKAEPSLIGELDRFLELGEAYVRAKIVRTP